MNEVVLAFTIIQVLLVIVFALKPIGRERFELADLFHSKFAFVCFNLGVFVICGIVNAQWQLFCNPVKWVNILLVLSCLSFVFIPFLSSSGILKMVAVFFSGLLAFIVVYTIDFGASEYFVFVLGSLPFILIVHLVIYWVKKIYYHPILNSFYLYPAIVLTPFWILYQLWFYFGSFSSVQRKVFLITPVVCLMIGLGTSLRMKFILGELEKMDYPSTDVSVLLSNPLDAYISELVLGAHWKYHTRICLYDGWRPPYHDPILVIGVRCISQCGYFEEFCGFRQGTDRGNAYRLYQIAFPNNDASLPQKCKCAKHQHLFE